MTSGATTRNGVDSTSDQAITRRGAEAIRGRAAEESADAAGEEIERHGAAGLAEREAAARHHHRHEGRERQRRQRPEDDDQVEQSERPARTGAALRNVLR